MKNTTLIITNTYSHYKVKPLLFTTYNSRRYLKRQKTKSIQLGFHPTFKKKIPDDDEKKKGNFQTFVKVSCLCRLCHTSRHHHHHHHLVFANDFENNPEEEDEDENERVTTGLFLSLTLFLSLSFFFGGSRDDYYYDDDD